MRIVLDTNVLVAAFISRGACLDLLEHCAERHVLVASEYLLDEVREKIIAKAGATEAEAAEAVAALRAGMEIVEPAPVAPEVCRDPDDRPILGTAVAGRCRALVTGDKDLLVLRRYEGIDIFSPAAFWRFEAGEAPTRAG